MTHRIRRMLITTLALAMLIVSAAQARDVEVVMKDGRKFTGELVARTPDSIIVKIGNIERTVAIDQIESVTEKLSVREQYELKRSKIADNDFDARYNLARELYEKQTTESLRLAMEELSGILAMKPDDQRASLLRTIVKNELEKSGVAVEPDPDVGPAPQPDPDGQFATGEVQPPRSLTREEINLIRVYEINLKRRPRIVVPRSLLDDMYEKYKDDPVMQPYLGRDGERKFRRLEGYEQLGVLFDLRARELYKDVVVNDEPEAMADFKTIVHNNYLQMYCGRCHGQGKAPGFYVLTSARSTNETIYTNYLLAGRTTVGPEFTDPITGEKRSGLPLINIDAPDRSPLVQYGLPLKEAIMPHPDVTNFKPYFHNGKDHPQYKRMIEWIGSLQTAPAELPIEFTPPVFTRKAAPAPDTGGGEAPAEPAGDAEPAK